MKEVLPISRDKDDNPRSSIVLTSAAFANGAGETSCFFAALYYKESEVIVENGQ